MSKSHLLLSVLTVGTLALAGCSTTTYMPSGETVTPVAQAQKECEYQAKVATASFGSSYQLHQHADKILGQAVGDGVVVGLRQADLISECMKTHGYVAAKGG